jgi:capsular polysaccharide transport system permease protein
MTQSIHIRRTPWGVMQASVYALVIRDIQKRFIKHLNTQRSLSVIWVVAEPLIHLAAWMLIRFFLHPNLNYNLPVPLFIMLGLVPFLIFRNMTNYGKGSIKGNKSFYLFRQIKPIDPLLAKLISECLVFSAVLFIFLLGLSWIGIEWKIYNLSYFILNQIVFLGFILGLSLIIAIACYFFNFTTFILSISNRVLYMLCGIFFSADMLPPAFKEIILLNPNFK